MSDDLISRKALLDIFRRNSIFEHITNAAGKNVIEIIKEQPTAYDMDKVLYDMKEAIIPIIDLKIGVKINGIQQTDDAVLYEIAVEIVKSGGVADE